MPLLAIETTCDETAAAVITRDRVVLSSVVASQDELHARWRGVVPEVASRAHVERIVPVIDEAVSRSGIAKTELEAVAVAVSPGLVGSLLVEEALGPGAAAFPGNMYVPINRLKPIFSELVTKGRLSTPPRPWLGIYTLEHMGRLVIGGISDGGPADRAGLQRGDVLHALNDEVLDDIADFYRKLWESGPAGTTIRLRMERDNDAFEVAVRSGDRGSYHKYGPD